ncbi:DUF7380 domain-containing protein [Rhodococcus daqingensis]|uniref:DUF7380 domain-containing protein n=1 Tax=Rhodococcus daqingensis TaxID=2479363 RepID=A0ABW2RVU7_9NOCA
MGDEDASREEPVVEPEQRDLAWYAATLDEVASKESRYLTVLEFRRRLGYAGLGDIPDDAPDLARAASWAFEYHVDITEVDGSRRARIVPKHDFGDRTDPPEVADIDQSIIEIWRGLLEKVNSSSARARLAHLLFERKEGKPIDFAHVAVSSYLESAEHWGEGLDALHDLRVATRIARAINDSASVDKSLARTLDLAQKHLDEEDPPAGVVLGALEHAIGEPSCPDRVDSILEAATSAWSDANRIDQSLSLLLRRCNDDSCRKAVWVRRVEAFVDEAESAESAIMRATRREQALELAEQSGDNELRKRAAVLLQDVRNETLEFIQISTSSLRYEEEVKAVRDSFIVGDNWSQALVSYGLAGPLSGDLAFNTNLVQSIHNEHPLTSLFPTQLMGPDNMPILTATTPEEKFEYDLARHEVQMISSYIRPLVSAFHEIPNRFGVPKTGELKGFLETWPGIPQGVVGSIVRAMQRAWSGDGEGAAYTLLPRIEAQIRENILQVGQGMYRLQKTHSPGQYPGLGAMLPIFGENYQIGESRLRFLKTTLTYSGGLNLRNVMLHGLQGDGRNIAEAALLIHSALMIGSVGPIASDPVADESNGDGASAESESSAGRKA